MNYLITVLWITFFLVIGFGGGGIRAPDNHDKDKQRGYDSSNKSGIYPQSGALSKQSFGNKAPPEIEFDWPRLRPTRPLHLLTAAFTISPNLKDGIFTAQGWIV